MKSTLIMMRYRRIYEKGNGLMKVVEEFQFCL